MSIEQYEVVVVGAGPSGLSAGIFVARQRAKCMLISKDLGGQLNLIPKLENYPGTIMSSGPLLAKTLENQYLTFGGEMTFDTVEKVEEVEGSTDLKVKTTRSEFITKALVLAPGKVPNNLGVENEVQYQNKGVHYCTKCDAPFYQGRTTATVGVGGYLLESGILLSRMASKVYLIYRGGQLGGDKDMIESLKRKNNVELVPNSSVSLVKGANSLQQIQIKDNSGVEKTIDVDGLFIEMGSKINLDFVKQLIKINTKGEIEVTEGGKTTHPAIFASGDATNIPYKQIVAACGDGAAAGLSAFNYIEKLKGKPGIRSDWKKTIGDTVYHY
ncbi:NAD(P)/FAD-dependent oxidoreductase [Candidatus Nitrosocosmicus hydrocola]|uniref:NAD(P)/FAD-dependent oxidoreductase n=1 Tax=Candidatus Nitrosocosmicus hydrocola TaxID=1826872 RepID=UPI00137266BC|nr:NAD(P)/FAD-dependent oxidoreductase [Candidatus Nitrosocosmicus hydrocola]